MCTYIVHRKKLLEFIVYLIFGMSFFFTYLWHVILLILFIIVFFFIRGNLIRVLAALNQTSFIVKI